MKILSLCLLVLFAVGGAFCLSRTSAQEAAPTPTGIIHGRVLDGSGGAIPGALVKVSGSGGRFEVSAGAEGRYRIAVPTGKYSVQAFVECGHSGSPNQVDVETAKSVELDVRIQVYRQSFSDISIYQLIANPETFDGRYVRVQGYYRFGGEMSQLFASKDDADFMRGKNSLWVTFDNPQVKWESFSGRGVNSDAPSYFNAKPVVIEGIFDKNACGSGVSSGSIRNVARIAEMRRYFDGAKQLFP